MDKRRFIGPLYMEGSIGAAITLSRDYSANGLRRLARASRDARQTRRLLALTLIHDGGTRGEAAHLAKVGVQIIRDWVVRFNAEGPDGLINRRAPGKPSRLNDVQRAALAAAVEARPKPYLDGVARWRLVDPAQWLWDEFAVSVSRQTLGRELAAMGFSKISARARQLCQDEDALVQFKNASSAAFT